MTSTRGSEKKPWNLSYWVIIPALNEESSLPSVLSDLWNLERPPEKIIVSDNGSTDKTALVAQEGKASLVWEPSKGYGRACQKALEFIQEWDTSSLPELIVFMDGDGSDVPEDMELLLEPFLDSSVHLVLGSRTLGKAEAGSLTPVQRFGNRLSCFLLNLFYGKKFTDLGPFRAIRTNTLFSLGMKDENFGWTVELQAKVALQNLEYKEVPVQYKPRKFGVSKVSGNLKASILAGIVILKTILGIHILHQLEIYRSMPWFRFLLLAYMFAFIGAKVEKTNPILLLFCLVFCYLILFFPFPSPIGKKEQGGFFILTGIMLRIPFLFFIPLLSDDFFRTIWDARIIMEGINPYTITPTQALQLFNSVDYIQEATWLHLPYYDALNSKNFYSFYPPFQHIFSILGVGIGNMIWFLENFFHPYQSVIGLKVVFFIFDIANLYLLRSLLNHREDQLKYYAWNPLILLEGMGNLHFELIMTTGILLFLYASRSSRSRRFTGLKAMGLMLGIGTKLLPILILPFIFMRSVLFQSFVRRREKIWIILLPSILVLGVWIFLILPGIERQWERGMGLYSHSFEFFSFVNRYLRIGLAEFMIDYSDTGLYIWILNGIAIISFFLYFIVSGRYKTASESYLLFILIGIVLVFSPVVHPWYAIPFLTIGIILGNRSSILASFLVFSSYSYYSNHIYQRMEMVVVFAYLLFFIFLAWEIYEYKCHRNSIRDHGGSLRNFH